MHLRPTDIKLSVLDVIPVEDIMGKTTVEISDRIYHMMAENLGPENVSQPETEENP
jgi:hypothetical protein